MTKYDVFFESIKSFVIDTGIAVASEFIGADENEVMNLENQIDFNFGLGMRTYLKHFGHKIGIRNFDLTKFTIDNILKAEEIAKKYDIKEKVINGNVVDGWHEKLVRDNLEQVCFVNYYASNHYFTFINLNHDNPILYGWDGGKESYRHEISITSCLRNQIFIGLKYICDVRRERQEKELTDGGLEFYNRTKGITIEGQNWLDIFRENYIGNNLFVMSKYKFDKEICLIESTENRLIELVEYGEKFEKMIKNEGYIEH